LEQYKILKDLCGVSKKFLKKCWALKEGNDSRGPDIPLEIGLENIVRTQKEG
jgi:hypothetical protein